MNSSILITGGSGFLGHGLVTALLKNEQQQRICIYSRGEHAHHRMAFSFREHAERMRYFIGDVRDLDRLERAMNGVQTVIHAAALKRIEVGAMNPDEMVKTNVIGTMNVIEAARRARVGKIVLVSSDKAYAPVSPYGQSKALAESLMLAVNRMTLGPSAAVCRYGNVSGSTGSLIPVWRHLLASGERVAPVTDPDCTRFWMRRDQAVDLVLSAVNGDDQFLIPELPAYRIGDIAIAMGFEDIRIVGLNTMVEKKHESMDATQSSEHARRMSIDELKEELKNV